MMRKMTNLLMLTTMGLLHIKLLTSVVVMKFLCSSSHLQDGQGQKMQKGGNRSKKRINRKREVTRTI